MKKNDEFKLDITGMTAEGSGVGRKDGMAVFVANTAVGDTVLAHAVKVKKNYAIAKAMDILTASADRIEVDCPAFKQCGGCVYRHISYTAELKIKQQHVEDVFKRIGGIEITPQPIIGSEKTDRYRNKAQLPIGTEKGKAKIGFYSFHSHNIVNCGCCRLQPEVFSAVTEAFKSWLEEKNVSVYNEENHSGLLRHLYIRSSKDNESLSVCVVINGTDLPEADSLWQMISPLGVTELSINVNREKTNVILGDTVKNLYGKAGIKDVLLDTAFEISPLSFYQVNRDQAEKLYSIAAEYAALTPETVLLDMYCGVGTIGLTMAKRVKELIGVEIVAPAVEDAKKNAALNSITNARFICSDASKAAEQLKAEGVKPDVIILDPPRKGCDEALIKTVAEIAPERVVYISCDPATLARDCAVFKSLGYNIAKKADGSHLVTPVDMFPRTAHVETVVLLSK